MTITSFQNPKIQFILVGLIGVLMYSGSISHGYVLDDNLVITSNEHILEGFSGIPELFKYNYAHGHGGYNDGLYRPLSLVTFAVEYELFGFNNALSHLIQILLYGLLLLALYLWLHHLFDKEIWIPFLVTLLFAAHPIHTEVVANLKSRDELLAMLFFCAAAYHFTKWLGNQKPLNITFAFAFMFVASFSKESAVTFAAVFPLIGWYKKTESKKAILGSVIVIAPIMIFLLIRQSVLSPLGPVDSGVTSLLQNSLIENDTLLNRIGTGAKIQGLYFQKLLLPFNLSHDYSYNAIEISALNSVGAIGWLSITLCLLGLSIYGLLKREFYAFGILFYFITISAVSNVLILIGAMAAERFVFAPSLGFSIALIFGLHWFIKQLKTRYLTIMGIILVFTVLTIVRVPDWESNFTLFTADVDKVPKSARAQYDAGSGYIDEAKIDRRNASKYLKQARIHLRNAIEIWPDYQDAYNNLGISYMNSRDYENAYDVYSQFVSLFPKYSKARYNLGMTCYNLKRFDEAETHLESYLEANESNNDALYILAEAEGFQQKFDEAISHLTTLVSREPNKERGHAKLATAYAITNNSKKAEEEFLKAIELNPNNVETLINLTLLYLNQSRIAEARNTIANAEKIDPANERVKSLAAQLSQL